MAIIIVKPHILLCHTTCASYPHQTLPAVEDFDGPPVWEGWPGIARGFLHAAVVPDAARSPDPTSSSDWPIVSPGNEAWGKNNKVC